MTDRIQCLPLVKTTDGPIFNEKPGTLSALVNMTLQPGGFAEARGGMALLAPVGGSAPSWTTAGGYSCVHELATSGGWIRTYDAAAGAGSQYSKNLQLDPGGWLPFATGVVNDAVYWGADGPFSRVGVYICIDASLTGATWVYEYYNGSTWGTLTTAETIAWASGTNPGYQYASWTLPSNWTATSRGDAGTGNAHKYWMRCRLSAITSVTTLPRVLRAFGTWGGMRDVYVANHDPRGGGTTGVLKRWGQDGTTGEAFAVGSSLFSGAGSPVRMASYRGRVFLVNGKDAKRWDGANFSDIGLGQGAWTFAFNADTPLAGTLPPGVYRYYAAWGYGQATGDVSNGTFSQDRGPLYGYGRATYLGERTLAVASMVNLNFAGTTVPADAGCYAIYRTQDLTNVLAAKRPNMPALMIDSQFRVNTSSTFATTFGAGGVYTDLGLDPIYPPIEMFNYDVAPPNRPRFCIVYQNRLLLGTEDTWYWSDPFVPDRFRRYINFMSLAKATGGRHMGGAAFADQVVLFTEDETWGLTNIDLDVPNLYPVHPGIGCIAPDSVAAGDGLIIWAARDGIYAWDGGRAGPKKVSWDWNQTFGTMSYQTHGGSRGIIHNYHYDIRLASPDYTTSQGHFRLNLLTMQWSTITLVPGYTDTFYPFGPIHAPLGTTDPGMLHPIYGHGAYTTPNGLALFVGELTTQDAGLNYTCSAIGHFPLPPGGTFVPQRVLAYYVAADGWGTPSLDFPPGTSIIGDPVGAITTGTPDTGADYSVVGGTPAEVGAGTSNLQFRLTVPSAASGTVGRQRLFGFILEGRRGRIRVGSV